MITIDFTSSFDGYDEYEEKYQRLTEIALDILKLKFSPIVSISFVNNKYIHKINKKYRGIDRETDVISFAFLDNLTNRDELLKSGGVVALGDIYISIDKAQEQAQTYGHPLERELSFLYVHGLLHLLGYDHMNKEDEEVMFSLQEKILERR